MQRLMQRMRDSGGEKGQALAEYALILAFIAIVCVLAVTALGVAISGALGSVAAGF